MRMPWKMRYEASRNKHVFHPPLVYAHYITDEPKTTFVRPKYNLILFIQSYYFVIFWFDPYYGTQVHIVLILLSRHLW